MNETDLFFHADI